MPLIICDINLFDACQPIFALKEDGTTQLLDYVDTDNLSEGLASFCYQHGSSELRLFGPGDYCNALAQKISEIDNAKYSNMILNIEVNP